MLEPTVFPSTNIGTYIVRDPIYVYPGMQVWLCQEKVQQIIGSPNIQVSNQNDCYKEVRSHAFLQYTHKHLLCARRKYIFCCPKQRWSLSLGGLGHLTSEEINVERFCLTYPMPFSLLVELAFKPHHWTPRPLNFSAQWKARYPV